MSVVPLSEETYTRLTEDDKALKIDREREHDALCNVRSGELIANSF